MMSCCVNAFDHQNLKGHSSNKTPKNIRSRMLCFRCLASCCSICSFLYSVLYRIVCPFLCLSLHVLSFNLRLLIPPLTLLNCQWLFIFHWTCRSCGVYWNFVYYHEVWKLNMTCTSWCVYVVIKMGNRDNDFREKTRNVSQRWEINNSHLLPPYSSEQNDNGKCLQFSLY